MLGILGEVDEFIRIVLEIVEELGVVVEIADVFMGGSPNSFVGRDTVSDGEVFVEGFGAPVFGSFAFDERLQAAAIVALRGFDAGPVEERWLGRSILRAASGGDLALLSFRRHAGSAMMRGT